MAVEADTTPPNDSATSGEFRPCPSPRNKQLRERETLEALRVLKERRDEALQAGDIEDADRLDRAVSILTVTP